MGKTAQLKKKRRLLGLKPQEPEEIDQQAAILDADIETTIRTLAFLADNPTELKHLRYRGLRTALHNISVARSKMGVMNGSTLSGQVSDALVDQRWEDARILLQTMQLSKHIPKLGAVQRWVRFCDAASNRDGSPFSPQVLTVLDAILRTADPNLIPETNETIVPLNDWEPCSRVDCDKAHVDESSKVLYSKQFSIVMHERGEDRRTKNKFDFTMYHSLPDTIQYDSKLKTDKVDVPGVPGAFVIRNALSLSECNQIITASESIGYTGDLPLVGAAGDQTSVLAHNFFWFADSSLLNTLFDRCREYLPDTVNGTKLTGLNARWRLYRYVPGAVYRPHIGKVKTNL